MIAVVTIEGHKHIYDIYSCIVADDDTVILRVSYCFWDIIVYDVPISVIEHYISEIKNFGYLDLSKYNCRILEPMQNDYPSELEEDDFERQLYYQQQEYERY